FHLAWVCRSFGRTHPSSRNRNEHKGEAAMKWTLPAVLLLITGVAHAELKGKTIEYKEGKTVLEGYLVYDGAVQGKRPAVVVIPDWMGMSPFARDRANELAKLGYI